MNTRYFLLAIVIGMLSACGGGGSGGSDGISSGGDFSVPNARGNDGIDKFISLDNRYDNLFGQLITVNSRRFPASVDSTGYVCVESQNLSRSDFDGVSSIENNSFCVGSVCVHVQGNNYLISDTEDPDYREDVISFNSGQAAIIFDGAIDVEATILADCDGDSSDPHVPFAYPESINGEYKGYVYTRDGIGLNRSSLVTFNCNQGNCVASGDAIQGEVILEIVDENSILASLVYDGQEYDVFMATDASATILSGMGVPSGGTTTCYLDCISLGFEKQ